jgi:hypothetical protein
MSKNYYEMLGVSPTAALDEIKKAFRREIAKYHPDKVQHLGQEFQEIAAVKAAELTQAYKALSDESLRAEYDAELGGTEPKTDRWRAPAPPTTSAPAAEPSVRRETRPPAAEPRREPAGDTFAADRAGTSDLVRRAVLARFRQALAAEFGACDEAAVDGFEIGCAPPKGRFWNKLPPRILVRVVSQVDAAAVTETFAMAARLPRDKDAREVCIFLMGPAVAPVGELAGAIAAIAAERRKPAAKRLFLVPLSSRSWMAHIPIDAPAVVKSLVARLKSM